MGRTLATATMVLAGEFARWSKYRRTLRKEDKEAFDAMLASSKHHFSAVGYAGIVDSFETMAISIMLEQEKRIRRIEEAWGIVGRGSRRQQSSVVGTRKTESCSL
ncbi:MAG: hypothetical protein ABH950_03035 [Candidatus Altiarchaeota archaeon]